MDINIIKRFQGIALEKDFAKFKYGTLNKLDQWSCIASAMDWITVSVEHINSISVDYRKNMSSIEVYAFISAIDIIVEAVQQLHRVIHNKKAALYGKDRDIFKDNKLNQNDLEYFKTLRSCFGAHPVNLKEPGFENKEEKRRFASWSTNPYENETYCVILYSNQHTENWIPLTISLSQILLFGSKYYEYIDNLSESLKKQYDEFASEKITKQIPTPKSIVEHLDILLEESKSRLDSVVYRSILKELKIYFETEITSEDNAELVDKYRKDLVPLISEIHEHLQNMDFSDLKHENLLYPESKELPTGWEYWKNELVEHVFNTEAAPFIWESKIKKLFDAYAKMEYSSYEELLLLVKASAHSVRA